jgi:hypothetical protein
MLTKAPSFFSDEVERLVKIWRADPPDLTAMSDHEIQHMIDELGAIAAALDDEMLRRTE